MKNLRELASPFTLRNIHDKIKPAFVCIKVSLVTVVDSCKCITFSALIPNAQLNILTATVCNVKVMTEGYVTGGKGFSFHLGCTDVRY